jgi:hypothetical protein
LPKDLFDWDEGNDEDDLWFPSDFLGDDTDDDDIETLHDIQKMVGRPIRDIIDTFDNVAKTGRAGTVRGVRFSSGSEALLWLFRRGIFLYSTLVQFPDGSWGVAIGSSENVVSNDGEAEPDDIPF